MQLGCQITSYNTDLALTGQVQAHRSNYSLQQLPRHKSNVPLTTAAVKGKSTLNHLQRVKKPLCLSSYFQIFCTHTKQRCASVFTCCDLTIWYCVLQLESLSEVLRCNKGQKIIIFPILYLLHVCHERSSFLQCSSQP